MAKRPLLLLDMVPKIAEFPKGLNATVLKELGKFEKEDFYIGLKTTVRQLQRDDVPRAVFVDRGDEYDGVIEPLLLICNVTTCLVTSAFHHFFIISVRLTNSK